MEVIALTQEGCLISATGGEVKAIIEAVTGKSPKGIDIGQRIPAIDYATTIYKLKSLVENYHFKSLMERAESFDREVEELRKAVEDAAKIEV